jgi:hypothetical protein
MSPTVFSQMAALMWPKRTSWTGLFRGASANVATGAADRLNEFVFIYVYL